MGIGRINPLFIDSTKPVGDKLAISIELTNVILHDGDLLYFELIHPPGRTQRFPMQLLATKKTIKYRTEIWLQVEQQIKYRFVIETKTLEIISSPYKKNNFETQISERWQPILPFENTNSKRLTATNFTPTHSPTRKPSTLKSVKPLPELRQVSDNPICNPEYFEGLKSLLDDLA